MHGGIVISLQLTGNAKIVERLGNSGRIAVTQSDVKRLLVRTKAFFVIAKLNVHVPDVVEGVCNHDGIAHLPAHRQRPLVIVERLFDVSRLGITHANQIQRNGLLFPVARLQGYLVQFFGVSLCFLVRNSYIFDGKPAAGIGFERIAQLVKCLAVVQPGDTVDINLLAEYWKNLQNYVKDDQKNYSRKLVHSLYQRFNQK